MPLLSKWRERIGQKEPKNADIHVLPLKRHTAELVVLLQGRVKSAAAVARHVLDHTKHTLLVGDLATEFAKQMGFQEESLSTDDSQEKWKRWKSNSCQPNFWTVMIHRPFKEFG